MDNKEKIFISAVIYVHNAEQGLAGFLRRIIRVLEAHFEHSEIICVNDASEDDSLSVIREVCKQTEHTSVSVINMSYFHGLEHAMGAGVDLSIGDFVFEFDNIYSGFEDDVVMQVYKRSLEGFDIVSASPEQKEAFTSDLFYRIFRKYSDNSCDLTSESFYLLSRRGINRIKSMNQNVFYRKVLYANCGLKTDNLRYKVEKTERNHIDKKEQNYRRGLAMDSLVLFTSFGYRFSLMMTLFMMLVSVVVLSYTVLTYCLANPVEGWTTTVLFLSVSFFGLFGILTIVIKYLQLLLNLVYRRQHYSYESVEKLTK